MRKLKIRSHGMFGATHSWSYTVRSLMYEFYKMGHELYITSTDGYGFAPKEMSQFFNRDTDQADIDLCYTLPRNFKQWFNKNSKLKLGIFNWESTSLPKEWISSINDVDFILPSSSCVRDIFIHNGWSESKLITLPLGVDWEKFESASPMEISGLNKFVFLNVSIPHYRKNIDLILDAYYSSFSAKDDVSLIIKSSFDKPKNKFECDLSQLINSVAKNHSEKSLPKVHLVIDKLNNIESLYKRADCLVSASSFEGFGLPMLEGFAAGLQVIAPRCSGQLDFLTDENSFLVDVQKIKAGEKYQYWRADESSYTYLPSNSSLIKNMKSVFSGKQKSINLKLKEEFSWKNSANKIINIYENFSK
jgi:glycosyltransferase involved in cell wall biosynthesis